MGDRKANRRSSTDDPRILYIPRIFQEEDKALPFCVKLQFRPETPARILWDIFLMLVIVYQAISVPFRICFSVPVTGAWVSLEFTFTLVFILDIFVNFNTGFYMKGELVMTRKLIVKNYLKFWFWLDLLASFPYYWLSDGPFSDEPSDENLYRAPQVLRLIKLFRLLRLLRLAKLKRILMKIEDHIASNSLATLFVLLRLLSVVFFIAHWTACWWYFIGSQEMASHPVTWVLDAQIENAATVDRYITALY